ncbi:MAG: DUF3419 family protein [Ruminococcus sp.]|nr:DUF3419 family protein [Ruminococcus sp.]
MNDVIIKSMIYYDREDSKDKFKYKQVVAINPEDVKYEDGMFTFKFIRYFNIKIDNKEYYVVIDKKDKSYAFGMSETLHNLIERSESGEEFVGYERELIDNYISRNGENYTFWVTGRKVLMLDYIHNKVSANRVYDDTADLDLKDDEIVAAKIEWYIEYKKQDDDKWYIKPTFCSDKKFRYEPTIEKYRFVKVAVYEIQGSSYSNVIERENVVYENNQEINNRDEIEKAIDSAKTLIYGRNENSSMFEGYTRIYPFNTEDSSSVFKIQEDKIRNKDTLTVTGSGDALLDLFMYGASTVTCFDINGLAKFYALLKFSFVKAGMSYHEFETFFLGKDTVILSKKIYDKYSSFLDRNLKRFWDSIYEYLNANNVNLVNSEHNLFYKIYDFFGTANKSYHNNCSYFGNGENYTKLQEILKNKTLNDINFVDSSLFDLSEKLVGKKYGYAYLSNILDFTDLYFDSKNELDRKLAFKEFVLNNLTSIVEDNGTIDVGYITQNWQLDNTYTLAFTKDEDFDIKDLEPYNDKDKVIVFVNRKLDLNAGMTFK